MKSLILYGLFLAFFSSYVFAQGIMTISAHALIDAYNKNEQAANKRFMGKFLIVTGKVGAIEKDLKERAFITFQPPNPFDDGYQENVNPFSNVKCYFDNPKDIEELSKGERIAIQGKCAGLEIINVILSDCQLIK